MKYVMFSQTRRGMTVKVPVIFPGAFIHADVARRLKSLLPRGFEVVSAGEVTVEVGEAHGKSTTLGLEPMPNDDKVINTHDYLHGIEDAAAGVEEAVGLSAPYLSGPPSAHALESLRASLSKLNEVLGRIDKLKKP